MTRVPSAILEIFALVLSPGWITRWEKQRSLSRKSGQADKETKDPAAPEKHPEPNRFYDRVFSLRVTLWYMIFQRLNFDQTLAAVVMNARRGGADRLSGRKRKLSKRIRSTSTSAYNQARQRLPLEFLQMAVEQLRGWLVTLVGCGGKSTQAPPPDKRSRQLLDGSTLCALVNPDLGQAYPPARNGKSISHWCTIRILVGFCARSGAILSAIEGAGKCSEQTLSWALMDKARKFTVWIGDRNFGVWSVVSKARACQQDVLVRMTGVRANKLAGGVPLHSGEDRAVTWYPSRHDKGAPGVPRQGVKGRLIYVRLQQGSRSIDLFLFTTLDRQDYPLELLVQWYGQRWQAEMHFRSVKTQMEMEQLFVASAAMARKEFYAGVLAYSLIRAAMWAAAEGAEVGIKKLSFTQARRALVEWLKDWGRGLLVGKKSSLAGLLQELASQRLPNRRKPRPSEVRRVRHRSQKFPPLVGSRADARRAAALHEQKNTPTTIHNGAKS